ncbi:hypothetical protein [Paenibacillus sp. FSL H8-0537]|uniref:hypothetical protein n=1 Tax=Paenibacillus sp. FSL H8-0537 TaxID=2921399 RepID=UPI003100F62D
MASTPIPPIIEMPATMMGIDRRIHIQLAAPGQRISLQLQECFLKDFIALQGEAEQ